MTSEQERILAKLADTMLAEEADIIARNIEILSDPEVIAKNTEKNIVDTLPEFTALVDEATTTDKII